MCQYLIHLYLYYALYSLFSVDALTAPVSNSANGMEALVDDRSIWMNEPSNEGFGGIDY